MRLLVPSCYVCIIYDNTNNTACQEKLKNICCSMKLNFEKRYLMCVTCPKGQRMCGRQNKTERKRKMKKNRAKWVMMAVLLFGAVFALGGCAQDDSRREENTLSVTVQEVREDSLIVVIADGQEEANLYGTLLIPNWFSHEVKAGDTIWIRHNGKFLKTSPATLAEIFEMKTTDENGLTVHVTAD